MATNYFYETYVKPYQKYEEEAAKRIKTKFNVEIVKFNNNNEYDFVDNNDIKYEVKYDGRSNTSNNVFIEFLGYGKPSGINVTQAKYYIITDGNLYLLILTKKLKKLITNCPIKFTKDGSTAGYIINKNIIISNSTFI
jgi:hypothetical protein